MSKLKIISGVDFSEAEYIDSEEEVKFAPQIEKKTESLKKISDIIERWWCNLTYKEKIDIYKTKMGLK